MYKRQLKRREDLKLEKEHHDKELEIAAKLKMQEDEKLRKEQIALAEQKSYEEAESVSYTHLTLPTSDLV